MNTNGRKLVGIDKEGIDTTKNGNTFKFNYKYKIESDPVEIFCMLSG